MFDQFKAMGALAGLMKNQDKLKAAAEELKDRLGEMRVSAETGGGAVRATASGHMRIVSIEVEPAVFTGLAGDEAAENKTLAEDLIAGAVNAALTKAQELAQQELAAAMSDMGLPDLPPDFGRLLGG